MIRFERFGKTFGETEAVRDLSLEIARGEIVALLGPNGSGKTTSLKAAAGLLRPTRGRVLVGDPERPASEPDARRALSFLPQKVSFPEALTGLEVVEFYRRLRGADPARTGEVLRLASLNGSSSRPVGTYSGGMVQRLGLAVAALPDAPVLLLDEPTAALDPSGLTAFYALAEERRASGRTVLFTSHHLGDVERLADRFAVLVEGRLAAVLTADELVRRLADRGVMRLALDRPAAPLLPHVLPHAPQATAHESEHVVPGPATERARVLEVVRSAGAGVRSLTAEEGRLDALYDELVKGERP